MAVHGSKEYPGIGFNYDASKQPFFKAMVKEELRKLERLPTGKKLLRAIGKARPGYRVPGLPKGVNVVIQPPLARQFNAPGLKGGGFAPITMGNQGEYDDWYYGRKGKLMPTMNSKISAQEDDKAAAHLQKGGAHSTGCTCIVFFSNFEMLSKAGVWLPPHITIGHELIHCYHYMTGSADPDYKSEEHKTVGIKGFQNEEFTENKLRYEAGMKPRAKYFSDD